MSFQRPTIKYYIDLVASLKEVTWNHSVPTPLSTVEADRDFCMFAYHSLALMKMYIMFLNNTVLVLYVFKLYVNGIILFFLY